MTGFYCKSGSGVTDFVANTVYVAGNRMVPNYPDAGTNFATARKWVWECTTGGTAAAVDPTWPASVTQDVTTVISGGATFTARRPGYSSGSTANWTFATPHYFYGVAALAAAGDILYVSSNHNETIPGGANGGGTQLNQTSCTSVNDAAAPPTALLAGASISTTGAGSFSLGANPWSYYYGLTFNAGVGGSSTSASINTGASSSATYENCNFVLATTGANVVITLVGNFLNCRYKFGAISQTMALTGGKIIGGSLLAGGVSPETLFNSGAFDPWQGRLASVEDLDLSNAATSIQLLSNAFNIMFRKIKMPAGWLGNWITIGQTPPAGAGVSRWPVLTEVGSVASAARRYTLQSSTGVLDYDPVVFLPGGATDGTTPYSFKISTNGLLTQGGYPFSFAATPEFQKWNVAVGAALTASVEILHDGATPLTDQNVWLELHYFSESGSPLGTYVNSMKPILAAPTNIPASAATWTAPGVVVPNAQKLSLTFTPQLAGFVVGRVCSTYGQPGTTSVLWVDGKLNLA